MKERYIIPATSQKCHKHAINARIYEIQYTSISWGGSTPGPGKTMYSLLGTWPPMPALNKMALAITTNKAEPTQNLAINMNTQQIYYKKDNESIERHSAMNTLS